MNIREFVNQNSMIVGAIGIVVLIGAMWFMLRNPAVGGPVDAYWVDLSTGEWLVAPTYPGPDESEIEGPAVRLFVYSCSSCSDRDSQMWYAQKTVYLAPDGASGPEREAVSNDLDEWFLYGSPEGQSIREMTCADGAEAQVCMP